MTVNKLLNGEIEKVEKALIINVKLFYMVAAVQPFSADVSRHYKMYNGDQIFTFTLALDLGR